MIAFYIGSGSPYAWRVWLALEHKRIPYELKIMSFSSGDLKTPQYLDINPRGRVPAIFDDGFALFESVAIMEYLDEAYDSGAPLYPGDARQRATVRRGTGGKVRLGSISKRGDPYLRTLLILGARSVLYHAKMPTAWASAIKERRPANVAAVAIASKMARTAWAILARGQAYQRDHISVRPA